MQSTPGLHCLQKAISFPICSTEKVGLVAYPLERWMVMSLVLSVMARRMPS